MKEKRTTRRIRLRKHCRMRAGAREKWVLCLQQVAKHPRNRAPNAEVEKRKGTSPRLRSKLIRISDYVFRINT